MNAMDKVSMKEDFEQEKNKVIQELESSKFDNWEFVKKPSKKEYFLNTDIYTLIGSDFSDADGYILLKRKIEVEAYSYGNDEHFKMKCDRIIFLNKTGEPILTDYSLYGVPVFDERLLSEIELKYYSEIKKRIIRMNPVENTYWRAMKIMHPIRLDNEIPLAKKRQKMEEAFNEHCQSNCKDKFISGSAKSKDKARQDLLYKEIENLRGRMKNKIGKDLYKVLTALLTYGYKSKIIELGKGKPKIFTITLPTGLLGETIERILEKEITGKEAIEKEMEEAKSNNYISITENKDNNMVFIISI